MEIYTTYFAMCRKLPDSIIPISIALYPPTGWSSYSFKILAPSRQLLQQFKQDGDWDDYVRVYNEQLKDISCEQLYDTLRRIAKGRDVAFVCYEKDRNRCHRSLVAEWLERNGVPCSEWRQ